VTPFEVLDWRRRIARLYAVVRDDPVPQNGWRMWHDERQRLISTHPASMIAPRDRAGFRGIHVFAHNPDFRFAVDVEPLSGDVVSFELAGDGHLNVRPVARTLGLEEALAGELTIFSLDGYGGGLFLPFCDATNDTETYGGGRYLLDTIKGADLGDDDQGRLIIDFNFAYYPSCAHSSAYVCPLSPPENRLSVAVRAGERWADPT
jgi:uncharacterized protein (DUF1684 family)